MLEGDQIFRNSSKPPQAPSSSCLALPALPDWQKMSVLNATKQRCLDAETNLKLAEFLCEICSIAAPSGALKSGDQVQVQRLTLLVQRLQASTAAAKAQHARKQRAK
jgi:hypothetical protein